MLSGIYSLYEAGKMRVIYVLGANIPHHNLTILTFFNEVIAKRQPITNNKIHFMVVSSDKTLPDRFSSLSIDIYDNKVAIATAIQLKSQQSPNTRFFFHGQFNPYIWLALLRRKIKSYQCWWHVWGADLYEDASGWKYRLFYLIRRLAQKRLGHVFATRGDLTVFQQRNPNIPTSLLYFPTRMSPQQTNQGELTKQISSPLTLLIGNSGDRSNRHIDAIYEIKRIFGCEVNVIIPMGYPENNQSYIDQVTKTAISCFGSQRVEVLMESLPFNEYKQLLKRCDLAYMIFQRQQGIGTICLLIQANIPIVLNKKNPFWQDLTEQNVPFLFYGETLSIEQVRQVYQQLVSMNKMKIAFFNPNYIDGWITALQRAAEE